MMQQSPTAISPRFLAQTANKVRYWREKTALLTDDALAEVDRKRRTIYQTLEFSLDVPELARDSAELILNIFKLIEQRAYWSEWLPVLEKALAVLPDSAADLRIALLNQTGFIYRLQRNHADSLRYHNRAADLAQRLHRPGDLAITHFHLANTYIESGDLQQSHYHALQARDGFQTYLPDDHKKQAAAYNILGLIAQYSGDPTAAVPLYTQAIAHWQQTPETAYLVRSWCNKGHALAHSKDYENALQAYAAALDTLGTHDNHADRFRIATGQGIVYMKIQALEQAEAHFASAGAYAQQLSEDVYSQALTAHNLGHVLVQLGRWAEAQAQLEVAVARCQQINLLSVLALSQGWLAITVAHLASRDKGLRLLDQAIVAVEEQAGNDIEMRQDLDELIAWRERLSAW
jgi:tetratricopeptide (TPR) repeat protein